MYAHEAIKDIKKIIKKGYMQDEYYLGTAKTLAESIRTSQKFHLGNIATFVNILDNTNGQLFMGTNAVNIKCPYPEIWFDYDIDFGAELERKKEMEGIRSSKRGIYMCEVLPDAILCQTVSYINSDRKWIPSYLMHLFLINDTFKNRLEVVEFIKEGWGRNFTKEFMVSLMDLNYCFLPVSDNMNQIFSSGKKGEEAVLGLIKEDRTEVSVLNMALKLLCCKNIVSEDITPMKTVTKKKKRKAVPNKRKFVYKVLNLVLPKTRKKREVNKVSERTVRVHFCRGHFKTYTEEAPLFGKLVGTFWWQPQVRGNPSDGGVFKSYKVSMA